MEFLEIDGAHGEGGGQIVRTAVSLGAALGKKIKIHGIRAGRRKPGLSWQHKSSVESVKRLTNARLVGLSRGSMELEFDPGPIQPGRYIIDIGTAGSTSLVLQTFIPPAMSSLGTTEIEIIGGTDVPMSPPFDYLKNVYEPLCNRIGGNLKIDILSRGHYPRGGGHIRAAIRPSKLRGFNVLQRGELQCIKGVSHGTGLPRHVPERQARSAEEHIQKELGLDPRIMIESVEASISRGSGVVLWAEYDNTVIGASSLGKRGRPSEVVGRDAAKRLLQEIRQPTTVDSHMGDQLVPLIALSEETSSYIAQDTRHLRSVIYVAERITGCRFSLEPSAPGAVLVRKLQNP